MTTGYGHIFWSLSITSHITWSDHQLLQALISCRKLKITASDHMPPALSHMWQVTYSDHVSQHKSQYLITLSLSHRSQALIKSQPMITCSEHCKTYVTCTYTQYLITCPVSHVTSLISQYLITCHRSHTLIPSHRSQALITCHKLWYHMSCNMSQVTSSDHMVCLTCRKSQVTYSGHMFWSLSVTCRMPHALSPMSQVTSHMLWSYGQKSEVTVSGHKSHALITCSVSHVTCNSIWSSHKSHKSQSFIPCYKSHSLVTLSHVTSRVTHTLTCHMIWY